MTGALSIPFAVAAAWMPSLPQKALFGTLTLFCLAIAFFKVWQLEAQRVLELETVLSTNRPLVVPEVLRDRDRRGPTQLTIANVGQRPALSIRIERLGQLPDRVAEFETVQMLRTEDGRISVSIRTSDGGDLEEVLSFLSFVDAMRVQREDVPDHKRNFTVPLCLRYSDSAGQMYEDRSFAFMWIDSVTGIPLNTELVIRRTTDADL